MKKKLILCVVLSLVLQTASSKAQDAGAPDSLKMVFITSPVNGTNVPVVVECSVFVDANSLSTMQFAWRWDNTSLQMDSAKASAEFNALEIGPFFFLDNNLATTNDSQIAITSGTGISSNYPSASSWRRLVTYYMTMANWGVGSTLLIDTVQLPGLPSTDYQFIPVGGSEYDPIWGGPIEPGCNFGNDTDNDGIDDCVDNCILDFNPSQSDLDLDGIGDGCDDCISVFNPAQADTDSNGVGDACCCIGIQGDANGDGKDANIIDLTFLLDYIFRGSGNPGPCPSESDVNSDGNPANILDLVFLVEFIFRGGEAAPACP